MTKIIVRQARTRSLEGPFVLAQYPTNFINPYPTVTKIKYVHNVAGTPLEIKFPTVKYLSPKSSTREIPHKFGNPEVGKAMAPEHKSAVSMTNRFECLTFPGKFSPISFIKGAMIIAATVWETKVAMVMMMNPKSKTITKIGWSSIIVLICEAMVTKSPELMTALPKVVPPIAKTTIVHKKLLKSSLVNNPVPNKATIGKIEMIPISPKIPFRVLAKHHRTMVTQVTITMYHCLTVKGSETGWIFKILTVGSIGKLNKRMTQIPKMQSTDTGMATINHVVHEGVGFIIPIDMMFCGDAIGEDIPPMLEAKAIPKINDFAYLQFLGNVLNRGWMIE